MRNHQTATKETSHCLTLSDLEYSANKNQRIKTPLALAKMPISIRIRISSKLLPIN